MSANCQYDPEMCPDVCEVWEICATDTTAAKKQPLKSCSVTECWHHVPLPNNKCQCSNPCEGRTGEPGCVGYKPPYVQVKTDKEV